MGLSRRRQFLLLLFLFALGSLTSLFVHTFVSLETSPSRPLDSLNSVASSKRQLSKSSGKGYMVAFHYYEQQTQALHNIFQLQCVADSFGMKIVEPFVIDSMFGFPFEEFISPEPTQPHLRVSDLINLDLWNKHTSLYDYPPVSSWETFLQEAPRNLVLSCIRYRQPPNIKIPVPGYNFRNGCKERCFRKFDRSVKFLSGHGFKVVHKSCSNFVDFAGSVSLGNFKENILSTYHPADVTVLLNEFRGLFGLYRLPLQSHCGIDNDDYYGNISVLPSSQILDQADKYAGEVFKGKPYVSVIARIERITLHLHQDIRKCAEKVHDILMGIKSTSGTEEVFLSMDVGKFGSKGASTPDILAHGQLLFQTIYGEAGWTFDEWEKSFDQISSSSNEAYVANLQRTITAKSECLIMFGGGGFQGQARRLYEKFHTDKDQQCIYRVCTSDI